MNFSGQHSDKALLKLLGERLAGLRLERNLTQQQVAEQAGLGLRTLQRLELGATATQLSGFIRVCRVLGLLENFESLIPEPPPSPMAQLKLQGKKRQRAGGKKVTSAKPRIWTWGEPEC
jgi:transcriptional regulator with XRE-family HTH domain